MAYLELTSGQVDADSPLDATLFGQIRDNDIYMKAEKLERDGTIPMTGNLAMGTNDISGAGAIDGTGDLTMDTITLTAGTGTGIDANGKDIICEDLTVNGNLVGATFVNSSITWSLVGTTEAAAAGILKDSGNTIDFTTHLTDDVHWIYAPAVKTYFCPLVLAVTGVDNVTTEYTTNGDATSLDFGTGNAYSMVENGSWITAETITSGAAAPIFAQSTIADDAGGLNRSWIKIDITFGAGGSRAIDVVYGGETTTVITTNNTANAICYLKMKTGSNVCQVDSGGSACNSSTVIFSVDHVTKFSEAVA